MRTLLPELSLVLVTTIWGGTFLAIKIALAHGGALGLVAVRFAVAGAVLLACTRLARPTRGELRAGVLIGGMIFLSYWLQAEGLTTIASSRSAFFTALYVPLVPLVQFAVLGRRPGAGAAGGIVLAFLGLVLLAHPAGFALRLSEGDWLTIVCAVAVSFEIILIGRYAPHGDALRLACTQMVTVAVLAAIALPFSGERVPGFAAWPAFWIGTAALGLATAFIMAVVNWAQRTVPALRATVIYALEPVWAGLIGALAGEPMDRSTVLGAALIVAGVLAGTIGRRRASPAS